MMSNAHLDCAIATWCSYYQMKATRRKEQSAESCLNSGDDPKAKHVVQTSYAQNHHRKTTVTLLRIAWLVSLAKWTKNSLTSAYTRLRPTGPPPHLTPSVLGCSAISMTHAHNTNATPFFFDRISTLIARPPELRRVATGVP